jgi:[ribosomal protein S5]-alanine N-acetyltransferase
LEQGMTASSRTEKMAPVLTTPRLRLRPLEAGDLDAMCKFWCDPENVKYFLKPSTREEVANRIRRNQELYREFGYGRWAVILPDGELIGDCGLIWQEVGNASRLEVGYVLRKDQWGNGYATEAARACVDHAFAVGQPEVIALIRPENTPSIRVAERLGMKLEKTVFWNGFDHCVYQVERDHGEA